jgi:hypothetical protein
MKANNQKDSYFLSIAKSSKQKKTHGFFHLPTCLPTSNNTSQWNYTLNFCSQAESKLKEREKTFSL